MKPRIGVRIGLNVFGGFRVWGLGFRGLGFRLTLYTPLPAPNDQPLSKFHASDRVFSALWLPRA